MTDWDPRNQHAQGVPLPSYRNNRGTRGFHDIQNYFHIPCWICGLSKPTGNVGQPLHHNR
ncbi:hypothetical protein DT536_01090 [Acinetobacter johnsonii]|nr:hypothetical protein DT536_01090 [Acinetobacter johnsonii]